MTTGRPPAKACGDCNLCCRLYDVDELRKPAGLLCGHSCETGCAIWGRHPKTCKTFSCLWRRHPLLDARWRPDVAGFVLRAAPDDMALWVDVDPYAPPGRWREAPYYGQLKFWSDALRRGEGMVIVRDGDQTWVLTPEEDLLIENAAPDAVVEAGYAQTAEGLRPWARIVAEAA